MALESGFASSPPRRRRPVIPTTSPPPSTAWHVVGRAARHGASMDLHHESRDRQRLQENRRLVAERGANGEAPATVSSSPEPGRPSQRDLPKSTCIQALCGETPFSNAVINFFKKMFQLFRLKGRAPGAPRTARWSFILRPVSVRTFPTTLGERPVRVKFKTTRPQGSRRRRKADLRHTGRRTDVARASAGPRNGTHEPGHATRTEGVFRPRRGRIA